MIAAEVLGPLGVIGAAVVSATGMGAVARHTTRVETDKARKAAVQKSEELIAARTQQVTGDVDTVIDGFKTQVEGLQEDVRGFRAELQALRDENRRQRADMDAIANEKNLLSQQVSKQHDDIVDLQTRDKLKQQVIDRIQGRLTAALGHIRVLTQQLLDHGHTPAPLPPELQDDHGGGT